MRKFYLDTNIFLNVLFEEKELYKSSETLLSKSGINFKCITSLLTLMEIHRVLQKQGAKDHQIEEAINKITKLDIEMLIPESHNFINAYEIVKKLKIDTDDAIHLAIAIDNEAELITRDAVFAKRSEQIISVITPEKII